MTLTRLHLPLALVLLAACSDAVQGGSPPPSPSPSTAPSATAELDGATAPPTDASASADGDTQDAGALPRSGESVEVVNSCTLPSMPAPGAMTTAKDVIYASPNGSPQALDLYRPTSAGTHPLVVLVHGGGWATGDKQTYAQVAAKLTTLGYVAASLNYRLVQAGGVNTFPTQVSDVRCAVRWLRAHAAEHGVDPLRVGALGGSAGGHLVAMLGVGSNVAGLDDGTCPAALASEPVGVKAVVAHYGPMDFRDPVPWANNASEGEGVINMLGSAIQAAPAVAALASPISHVSSASAPFFLAHGTVDTTVPVEQSRTFRTALQAAGGQATLVELPGVGHGFPAIGDPLPKSSCTSLAFLRKYLTP